MTDTGCPAETVFTGTGIFALAAGGRDGPLIVQSCPSAGLRTIDGASVRRKVSPLVPSAALSAMS